MLSRSEAEASPDATVGASTLSASFLSSLDVITSRDQPMQSQMRSQTLLLDYA